MWLNTICLLHSVQILGGIPIYAWLSEALQQEYDLVRTFKESPRGSVQLIRHKASRKNFILRRFTGNPEVYQKLLDYTCPNLPTVYEVAVQGAVGGAAGVTHAAASLHTDCEPNRNVEALRMALDKAGIESRPLWKPMHRQPVYRNNPCYVNGVSEALFKRGLCLPSGPCVTDEDVAYIVEQIKACIVR